MVAAAVFGLGRFLTDQAVFPPLVALLIAFLPGAVLTTAVPELARTDRLTGLLNRRAILERLQALYALSERHGRPLTLAVVDLDHFKRVNDAAGHLAGDDVLRSVAAVMADLVRDSDVIGRWGGDELLVVLDGDDQDRLLSRADHALYRAKESGRDRVVVVDRGEHAVA